LRGFYFDISVDVPGPIITDNESLFGEIRGILSDEEQYWRHYGVRYHLFRKKFNHADNGKASQKALEILFRRNRR